MTYDEALQLPAVAGSVTPFGGSWTLAAGSLTLVEPPTTDA